MPTNHSEGLDYSWRVQWKKYELFGVTYPSATTTHLLPFSMAVLNEGFSNMVSQRQLLRMEPNEEGLSPRCKLGTRPHCITCSTRSSVVSVAGNDRVPSQLAVAAEVEFRRSRM